ncbi:hypothetical protein LPJ61_006582 [Coemansia biformis]|uniref:Uncharacterized protein n=1 Tax=Coemansia biformis TaxID=1286918 RepID=A0A9W7XU76_9FUNG|nr:hypothetical protein LPJ61_006582 [Coemansia biformis]
MFHASQLRIILDEFYKVEVPDPDGSNNEAVELAEWINESYEFLEELVLELRACLFDNPNLPPWARGTQIDKPERHGFKKSGSGWRAYGPGGNSTANPFAKFEDPTICNGRIDPFRERTKEPAVSVLFDTFAETLNHYASLAQLHINKSEAKHASDIADIQDIIDEARDKRTINDAKPQNRASVDSDDVFS